MTLPHHQDRQDVPLHLKTRAELKALGYRGPRPSPVATVLAYSKVVFLYDAHPLGVLISRPRVRCTRGPKKPD